MKNQEDIRNVFNKIIDATNRAIGDDNKGIYQCPCGAKNRVDFARAIFYRPICGRCKKPITLPK